MWKMEIQMEISMCSQPELNPRTQGKHERSKLNSQIAKARNRAQVPMVKISAQREINWNTCYRFRTRALKVTERSS